MTPTFKLYNEMENFFINRTKRHIHLVRKYARKIEDLYPKELQGLYQNSLIHDNSKFEEPEFTPYIHVQWKYKLADEGKIYNPPEEIKTQMTKATEHHVKSNAHHPEYHTNQTNTINPDNRDMPPSKIIDASKMPMINIAEMVADWLALSEEKGTDPIAWANKNVNIRWKFTDKQKDFIYELINNVWKK